MLRKRTIAARLLGAAAALLIGAACFGLPAHAQTKPAPADTTSAAIPITTEIPIPTGGLVPYDKGNTDGKIRDVADYIARVYNYGIAIVGLLAAVMLVIGGFQYLTSAGNSGRISAAKKRMGDALIGLVLALSAYAILLTINPATLSFTPLSNELAPVRTELAFLPWCDVLAKQGNAAATPAPFQNFPQGCKGCGCPGYLSQKNKNANGSVTESRLWCLFREKIEPHNSGGCHNVQIEGESGNYEIPEVCMPTVGLSAEEIEHQFVATGLAPNSGHLARCESCLDLQQAEVRTLGYPSGPKACVLWMNLANNNDQNDTRFSNKTKAENHFILNDKDAVHEQFMYYCGWSSHYNECVTVNIDCSDTHSCKGYDSENLKWCYDKAYKCRDEDLSSFTGGSYGKHLGPICAANPCSASGDCNTGIIAHMGAAIGTDGASVALRGATFGLVDSTSCK